MDETFRIYRGSFWPFVRIAVIPQMPLLLSVVTPSVLSAVLSIIGLLFGIFAGAATIWAVAQQYTGQEIDVGECYRRAWGRVISLVAAVFILAVVLIGCAVLMLVLVGIPLFFYVLVIWFFAWQAIIMERKGPIEALRRSRGLVRGSWWRVFGIVIVFGVIVLALQIPALILGGILGRFSGAAGNVVLAAARVLTFPIGSIGATLLYLDLRVRKEGYTLEAMASDVGPRPPGWG